MSEFAKRLKECREKLKKENSIYTQGYVAKKIGVARTTYTAYENGTKMPPLDTVNIIADFFNVSTDFLLGREEFSQKYIYYNDIFHKLREKLRNNINLSENEKLLLNKLENFLFDEKPWNIDEARLIDDLIIKVDMHESQKTKEKRDIAKRLEQFKQEIENSDGLAFSGEPLSEEAKESLIESMEHIFRQTQRINKKYTPKKYRDEE